MIEAIKDDDRLRALGRVTANWAFYEQRIDMWLRVLLGQPESAGFQKNLRLEFKRRVDLWRDLSAIHHLEPDKAKAIADIIQRSAQARHDRDWAVHGLWARSGTIYKLEQTDRTKLLKRIMSLKRLNSIGDAIGYLIMDHTMFYQSFAIKLATGKDMPLPRKSAVLEAARRTGRKISNFPKRKDPPESSPA